MSRSLAILGGIPNAYHAFDASHSELWWLNNFCFLAEPDDMDQVTRWFNLHKVSRMRRRGETDMLDWLRQEQPFPVVMRRKYAEFPSSEAFPLRSVRELAPHRELGELFGCSHSYMLALGILEGFDPIHLYGVNLANPVETYLEKPSLAFWLGFAEARGITVDTTYSPRLMPEHLYGFGDRHAPDYVPRSIQFYTDNVEAFGELLAVTPD